MAEEPPGTIFTPLYKAVKDTTLGKFLGLDCERGHLGQFWFEAIMFSILVVVLLCILVLVAGLRKKEKIPKGLWNFWEIAVDLLDKIVVGLIGPAGSKYLPYLGTLFIYILCMNLLGIIPLFRSPTMTLSTTFALGITTFFVVQIIGIKENGFIGYAKHFTGDIRAGIIFLLLAPLMFVVHIIGELAKPMSLSLRLYGNIFGEDSVIENLIHMGGWLPLQFPMLIFAVFTSVLQAFIFTALTCIYISVMLPHKNGED
jgi:F-type H+-transporting ATPase subunit a